MTGVIVDPVALATLLNHIAPYQANALVWTDTLGPAVQRLQAALAEPEDERIERLANVLAETLDRQARTHFRKPSYTEDDDVVWFADQQKRRGEVIRDLLATAGEVK